MTQWHPVLSRWLALSVALGASGPLLCAQSPADTTSLATALANLLANDSTRPGDHRPPFILAGPAGSAWTPIVAGQLRLRHPNALAAAVGPLHAPHLLHVSVSDVRIAGDTTRAAVTWSRCTERQSGLNFWEHEMTYILIRSGKGWRLLPPVDVTLADGHC